MMIFLIIIHVIVCALLIALVLIQRGRGGGLLESFAGVESMFGTKTSAFLTKTTTILSVLFFVTCLSLALMSVRQSRSLMPSRAPVPAVPATPAAAVTQAPSPAAAVPPAEPAPAATAVPATETQVP